MKKYLIIFSFIIFVNYNTFSQNVFYKYIDVGENVSFTDISENLNSYIISGIKYNSDNTQDPLIIILSKDGFLKNLITYKTGYKKNMFTEIIKYNDDFLFIGSCGEKFTNNLLICKYDNLLNFQEQKILPSTNDSLWLSNIKACILPNNDIAIGGTSTIFKTNPPYEDNLFLYKISNNLDSLNSVFETEGHNHLFFDIIYLPIKESILISRSNTYDFIPYIKEYNINLDSINEIEVNSNFGVEHDYVFASNLKILNDSLFIFLANRKTINDITVALFDKENNIIKETNISTTNIKDKMLFRGIDYIDKNNIFIVSRTEYDENYFSITKIDSSLNILWQKFIFINDNNIVRPEVMKATNDGGCLVTGREFIEDNSYNFAIKVDGFGNLPSSIEKTKIKAHELIIYPNPSTTNLNIRAAVQRIGGEFIMYDITGKQILQQKITKAITPINTSNLSSGTYIYKYTHKDKEIESGKWVKE